MKDIGIILSIEGLRQYQAGLSKMERSTNQATGRISNSVSRVDSSFQSITNSIPGIGSAISSILNPVTLLSGALVGAGAAFVSATKTAKGFESQLATVGALQGIDKTTKEFQSLNEEARRLGASTEFSATQAAQAMEFLARAGFNASQTLAATENTLSLATVGSLDLARAADIATDTLSQFGLPAEELGRVIDAIAKTTVSANTNVTQFADAMNYLGPTAKALGISLEESSAAIGVLSSSGLKGSLATRALGTSLIRLTKPTKEAEEVIQRLGLRFFDSQGEFIGLNNTIAELERGFEGLNSRQRQSAIANLFGAEAVQEFNILLEKGSDALISYTDEIENASSQNGDFAQSIREIKLDTFEGSILSLRSAYEAFQIAIAGGSLDFLKDAFFGVADGVRFVASAIEDLRSGARSLGDIFGPIGVAVENFADAMQGAFVSLGNLLNEVFVANGEFGSFLSILNDIGQFVIGVLLDSFTRIARVFSFVVDTAIQIRAAFQGLLDTFLEVTGIGELFEGTLDRINNFFNSLLGGTADAAQGLSTFAQVLLNVRGIASGVFAAILQVVDNWASAFIGYLGGVGDLLAGIFTFDLDRIEAGFNAVTTSVGDATVRLFDGVRQAYNDGFAEVFNSAQDAANEINRTIGPQTGVELAKAVKEGVASEGIGPFEVEFVADNIALLSSIEPIQASLATIPDSKVIDIRIDTDEDGPNSLESAILRVRSLVNDLPSQLGGALDSLVSSGYQSAIQGITNSFVELGQGIGEALTGASSGTEKIKAALQGLVSVILVEVPKMLGLILIRTALTAALGGQIPLALALAAGGLVLLGISGIASGLLNRAAGETGAGIPSAQAIDFSGSIQNNNAAIINQTATGLSDQAAQPLAPNVNVNVMLDGEEVSNLITRQIEIKTTLTG